MKNIKADISIFILLFINFIFCAKYLSRYSDYGILISIILFIFQFLVFRYGGSVFLNRKLKISICSSFLLFIVILIIISSAFVPLETLKVDRWSVISSFLSELYQGNYPYYAESHMGNFPGPMPIYFLIAAPFHAIGALNVLSALGYIIITFSYMKKTHKTGNMLFVFFYLFTSFYLVWEILTRSNIFTYTVIAVLILEKTFNLNKESKFKFFSLAVFIGIVLSTRSVYILPYIIFFLPDIINRDYSFKKMFLFISVATIAFILTFVPFILIFYDDFFNMNPFIIQSSFLVPKFYTVLFIIISIVFALMIKKNKDKFFYSGLSLFTAIFIYSIYYLLNYGFYESYVNSKMDVSYFILCIPFLLKYLTYNSDKC